MKRKTHKRSMRKLFPWADQKTLDAASALIDNPPAWLSYIPQMGRVPGLRYSGHRILGHDLLGACLAALLARHPEGLLAVAPHLAIDLTRDWMVRRYGSSAADLAEDVFNVAYEFLNERKKNAKKPK